MRKSVEDKTVESITLHHGSGKCDSAFQRKTDGAELALKNLSGLDESCRPTRLEKLIMQLPPLPSIAGTPDFMGFIAYIIIPMIIFCTYSCLMPFILCMWFVFPLNYIACVLALLPLWIAGLRVETERWVNWRNLHYKSWKPNFNKSMKEYMALIKKNREWKAG